MTDEGVEAILRNRMVRQWLATPQRLHIANLKQWPGSVDASRGSAHYLLLSTSFSGNQIAGGEEWTVKRRRDGQHG